MEDPDNQAAASVVDTAENPEERETLENSLVSLRRTIPDLPPLPPPPPFLFPSTSNLPSLPPPPPFLLPSTSNLRPLPPLLPLAQLCASRTSPADTERQNAREFTFVTWIRGKPEAERTTDSPQLPNRPMSHTPEEKTFDHLKQRICNQLECLLCIEMMMPPIVVCLNGHMICDKCRQKLDKCPLCRNAITERRNIFAEEVSKLLKVRCRYANAGCLIVMHPDEIKEHEYSCFYQPVECLAGHGAKEVLKCGWKGKKCALLAHVCQCHGLAMIRTEQPIVLAPPCVYEQDYMTIILICAESELFWLTLKLDVKNKKRFEVIHFVGPASKAKEFRYTYNYLSSDGKTGTSFFSTTRSIFQETDVFASSPHFQMDLDRFKELFLDNDGHVPGYKLTIEKVLE